MTLLRSYSPIDMDYVQRNSARGHGAKLIFGMDGCTSIGPRVRSKAVHPCTAQSFEPCDLSKERALTCSPLKLALR